MLRRFLSQGAVGAAALLPVPVVAGDVPDPSAIFDNGQHVAVVTANGWGPSLRIYSSPNLSSWTLRGAVFPRPPAWAKSNFWAPELTKLAEGRYAVYYASRSKRRGDPWYCIGVAFASAPTGPYRDLGRPIRCGRYGSIDPYVTRDENGQRFLVFKDDGNHFGKPTHIFAQRLSEDGTTVSGPSTELIRDDSPWEGKVVEGPNVLRMPDGSFQMTYAGGLFASRKCNYAIGEARAPRLLGPWTKNPANPIIRGGNGWTCPGHATVYETGPGTYNAMYHAYRSGSDAVAGRQMIDEPATIGPDGWIRIGDNGTPPAPVPGAVSLDFTDRFRRLDLNWEWPFERRPGISTGGRGLVLRASPDGGSRLDAAVLARRVATGRYTINATLDRAALSGSAQGGLASFRDGAQAIGFNVNRAGVVTVWQRKAGRYAVRARGKAPKGGLLRLRLIARGDFFTFQVSGDGRRFTTIGRPAIRGPIEDSARASLIVGGQSRAAARFTFASVKAN